MRIPGGGVLPYGLLSFTTGAFQGYVGGAYTFGNPLEGRFLYRR